MSDCKSLVCGLVFDAQVYSTIFGRKKRYAVKSGRKKIGPWRDSEAEAWEAAHKALEASHEPQ